MPRYSLFVLLAMIVSSCAAGVPVKVLRPANFPEAAEFRNVSVLPFSGRSGREVASLFANRLSQAQKNDLPYFNVRYTKNQSGEAYYTGTVEVYESRSRNYTNSYRVCTRRKRKKLFSGCAAWRTESVGCTEHTAEVRLSVKLTMRRTGDTIYSQAHDSQSSSNECGNQRGRNSRSTQLRATLNEVLEKFYQDVAPHLVEQRLKFKRAFKNEGHTPKEKAELTRALSFLDARDVDHACMLLRELSSYDVDDSNLVYNIATCFEIEGDHVRALRMIRKSKKTLRAPDKDFIEAEKRLSAQVNAQNIIN